MTNEPNPPAAISDADPGLSGWEDPLASLRRALERDELQSSVSFSAIKDLQPDFIKVDGAVIRKVSNSAVARLKPKAIARVCSGAGIGMIAECVEEEHIINHLRQMSVGFAQEFGIALPQPIEIGGIQPARAPAIGE